MVEFEGVVFMEAIRKTTYKPVLLRDTAMWEDGMVCLEATAGMYIHLCMNVLVLSEKTFHAVRVSALRMQEETYVGMQDICAAKTQ